MTTRRADVLLAERGLAPSRSRARALIEAGKVRCDGRPVEKPSTPLSPDAVLEVVALDHPYVSRGGLKLEGALADLQLDARGAVVADLGASTGGFTDCVLRHGARRVYAVDVGHDQLHPRLRADPRVVSMEGVNARHMLATDLPEPVDLVVIDASFISLTKLLSAAFALLRPGGQVLALVKPQFEVGHPHVNRRGVVTDEDQRRRALRLVLEAAVTTGFAPRGHAECRVAGPRGNRELFVRLARP